MIIAKLFLLPLAVALSQCFVWERTKKSGMSFYSRKCYLIHAGQYSLQFSRTGLLCDSRHDNWIMDGRPFEERSLIRWMFIIAEKKIKSSKWSCRLPYNCTNHSVIAKEPTCALNAPDSPPKLFWKIDPNHPSRRVWRTVMLLISRLVLIFA